MQNKALITVICILSGFVLLIWSTPLIESIEKTANGVEVQAAEARNETNVNAPATTADDSNGANMGLTVSYRPYTDFSEIDGQLYYDPATNIVYIKYDTYGKDTFSEYIGPTGRHVTYDPVADTFSEAER